MISLSRGWRRSGGCRGSGGPRMVTMYVCMYVCMYGLLERHSVTVTVEDAGTSRSLLFFARSCATHPAQLGARLPALAVNLPCCSNSIQRLHKSLGKAKKSMYVCMYVCMYVYI